MIQGIGAANAMTADLADALKSQIYQCWSPPVGAPNADDLVVDFDLSLNPDGTSHGRAHIGRALSLRQSLYPRRRRSRAPRDLSMPALQVAARTAIANGARSIRCTSIPAR